MRPEGPIGNKVSFFSDRMKTSSVVVDLETKLFRVVKNWFVFGVDSNFDFRLKKKRIILLSFYDSFSITQIIFKK